MWIKSQDGSYVNARHFTRLVAEHASHEAWSLVATLPGLDPVHLAGGPTEEEAERERDYIIRYAEEVRVLRYPEKIEEAREAERRWAAEPQRDWVPEDEEEEDQPDQISPC